MLRKILEKYRKIGRLKDYEDLDVGQEDLGGNEDLDVENIGRLRR